MSLTIITQQEDDGRWIADVPSLKGVIVYGADRDEAITKVKQLALNVIEDRIEHGESLPAHTGKKAFRIYENKFYALEPGRLLQALLRSGWTIKREKAEFKILECRGRPDFVSLSRIRRS
ncbi:MAG: type II toxin-antitoxin system HicB family antitoxin [Acidobacteriota bacterium]